MFDNNNRSSLGYFLGMGGGGLKYISQLHIDMQMFQRVYEAAITAIICAIAGKITIDFYVWCKKMIIKKTTKNKS